MKKIRYAAIGVGGRLSSILELLRRNHNDQCELAAMSDESPEALAAARTKFGADLPAFTDYREVFGVPDVAWVLIGSKNYLHCEHCVAAFEARKNVFCEKPMAITIDQCDEIRKAHSAAGTLFATGFVLRYAPLYVKVKELLEAGTIGRIISLEANENLLPDHGGYIMRNWRRFRTFNGPHLLEKCSHDVDLINWMIGSVPQRVASFGGLDIYTRENKPVADRLAKPTDNPPLYFSWESWENVHPFTSEKDVEDNQVAILEYRNRARVTFHTNGHVAWAQRRMLICGLEGTIEADLATSRILVQRIGRSEKQQSVDIGATDMHGGADALIVADLAQSMASGTAPRASGEEGFLSAITCLGIDESMREGNVVNMEPIWKRFGV